MGSPAKIIRLIPEGGVPPNDLQAEAQVLAAIFEEPDCLDPVSAILRPEQVYAMPNRLVYEAMLAVRDAGDTPTLAAVRDWLYDRGKLQNIGGEERLSELMNSVPAILEPEREAERIVDKARLRDTINLCREFAARGYADDGTTSQTLLDELETRVFGLAERKTAIGFRTAKEVAAEVCREILDAGNGKEPPRFTTGLAGLDGLLDGLFPGDVTVVAARPGMGKTSFVLQLATAPAMPSAGGYATGIVEVEMPRRQLMHRLAGSFGRVPYRKVRRPATMTAGEQRLFVAALGTVSELPLEICDDAEITANAIRAAARRIQARHRRAGRELSVLVIDYLQLLETDHAKDKTREREVAEITRFLKLTAKQLGIHVVVAAQLNRRVETTKDKRPTLGDLRESGAIEQDADNVIFLYREDYYRPKGQKPDNTCEIIVAKQRNGPTGVINVRFDAACSRFDNLESDEAPASFRDADCPPHYADLEGV
jgi:replicative DNA helicase